MNYLIKVYGATRRDKIKNGPILEELQVKSILEKIEQINLRWLRHLIKMRNEQMTKCIW